MTVLFLLFFFNKQKHDFKAPIESKSSSDTRRLNTLDHLIMSNKSRSMPFWFITSNRPNIFFFVGLRDKERTTWNKYHTLKCTFVNILELKRINEGGKIKTRWRCRTLFMSRHDAGFVNCEKNGNVSRSRLRPSYSICRLERKKDWAVGKKLFSQRCPPASLRVKEADWFPEKF